MAATPHLLSYSCAGLHRRLPRDWLHPCPTLAPAAAAASSPTLAAAWSTSLHLSSGNPLKSDLHWWRPSSPYPPPSTATTPSSPQEGCRPHLLCRQARGGHRPPHSPLIANRYAPQLGGQTDQWIICSSSLPARVSWLRIFSVLLLARC